MSTTTTEIFSLSEQERQALAGQFPACQHVKEEPVLAYYLVKNEDKEADVAVEVLCHTCYIDRLP